MDIGRSAPRSAKVHPKGEQKMNKMSLLSGFTCILLLVACATPQLPEYKAAPPSKQISRIHKGMTGEEVILRWGNPDRIAQRSGIGPYWEWYYGNRFLLQFSRPDGVYTGDQRILMRIGILGGSIPSVLEWVESASK